MSSQTPTAGTLSRRDLMAVMASTAITPLAAHSTIAADALTPNTLTPLNRFSRMVHEFYVQQVRAGELAGLKARAVLKTKADAEKYVRDVQGKILDCFGPFPTRTPLNPRITGKLDRDAYVIEKVIFESRPGLLVTANLYLPKGRKTPMPGVVGSCGHSTNGKEDPAYQSFAQGLARQGYVVLIFDPIGQGERLQYTHIDSKVRPKAGVGEHLYAGNQQFLVGEFFGSWRAWDGMRALDYLLTRPEVDPKHVGITGNSGGGTETTWLCGVEPRWTMAAPSCFVTTFRRNMENELPADTEQCPPRCIAKGLDHLDFLAAMAPKPVIILAKEKDFFDVRGSEEAYARLRDLYSLLDAKDNLRFFAGPTEHGYSQENREAMYRWFNHVTKISDAETEPALTIEKPEELHCTPTGQVAAMNSRTVFSFTRDAAKAQTMKEHAWKEGELERAVAKVLKLPERVHVPDYRILRPVNNRKYPLPFATTYAVETEPGAFAIVYRLSEKPHLSRPTREPGRAVLYVSHQSADAELREEPLIGELLKNESGSTFYTCDVRGIGDSRPETCGANAFTNPYGSDYFYAVHGIMLDRPYAWQRTFDVLRVLDLIRNVGHREIHLVAKGWGAIPATFAALLSDKVTQVTLKNALTSYADVATSELYSWPLSSFVPGVLSSFDLPDCYRALESKKLRQIDPVGANGVIK